MNLEQVSTSCKLLRKKFVETCLILDVVLFKTINPPACLSGGLVLGVAGLFLVSDCGPMWICHILQSLRYTASRNLLGASLRILSWCSGLQHALRFAGYRDDHLIHGGKLGQRARDLLADGLYPR